MKNSFMKTLAFAVLCVIGVHTSFAECTASLFAGGTGSQTDPYKISTPEQLQNLNQCLESSENYYRNNYYILNNDIDLTSYLSGAGNNSGAGWKPIGYAISYDGGFSYGIYPFAGKFNGNGHKVSGLWIKRPAENNVGLFSYVSEAEIRNVGVEIDNSKGGVAGDYGVGGLVGNIFVNGTIINSYATGSVSGKTGRNVGGLVGYNNAGTISNSYATGNVSGTGIDTTPYADNGVGGLVGCNGGTIINSYATGSVSGNNADNFDGVGGLVGSNSGPIINSYATGRVSGNSGVVGGLVGGGVVNNNNNIINSYYDKQTTGRTDTGKGIGKTTAEMKTKSTYVGWDFEGIWEINNGYPTLFWQNQDHFGNAIVAAIPNQTWTGSPITPKPSISFKGNNLTEGTNFEYAYGNNIQTGTATLKIVGKGSYDGQAKLVEFKIIAADCGTGLTNGAGTETNPYKISEAKNLDAINNCLGSSYSGKYYELQNDIDLSSYIANTSSAGWQPIGSINKSFYGKFNGNNHKVSGLWINRPEAEHVGLFSDVGGAEIRNVGVEIDNSKGGVVGNSRVGGLVGSNSGTIINSYATGRVSGNSGVGGLVGYNYYGTISNSYATGNVTGSSSVGGLVGYIFMGGTIINSYATGNVSGSFVGGLVGWNSGSIINSYATGRVTGTGYYSHYSAGLVGNNDGTISNGYYDMGTTGMTGTGTGIGKTTAEMKTKSTYQGWDFEGIWEISSGKNNGYPTLFWQNQDHFGNAIVAAIPNQTWTGSPITPKPTSISINGNNLTEGTNFEYAYDNNIQTGTATLKIVGKDSYLGQAKLVEFKIIAAVCGIGFTNGAGTETNPYKISEAKNLDAISNCLGSSNSGKYYELQNDIDLSSYIANTSAGWQPIGNNSNSFYGKFNGNNHKVSGLWINRPAAERVGLFGEIYSGAEIKSIGVEIDEGKGGVAGNRDVGGLVGGNYSIITNSYAIGSVSGGSYVGGLVGRNDGTISNSYAIGSISGSRYVGGLVGLNLVGSNYSSGTISNSYATGKVTGSDGVGGLVGSNYSSGTISSSYYDRQTSGQTDTDKGIGKTTAEMKTQSTYVGWDFENTWVMPARNNYPILKWQLVGKTVLDGAVISSIPSQQPYTGSAIKPAFTVTLNGTVLTENTDYTVSYSNNRNVGTVRIIIIGIRNYVGSIETSFAITPKPVTITGISAASKMYDGNTTATVTGTATINGKIPSDDVTVIKGTASFDNANVGNNKTVTFRDFSLFGTDADNYTLSQPASVTASITVDKCGTSTINYDKQFCYNDKVYSLCNGNSYDPEYEKCSGGALQYKCGKSSWYNDEKQFCWNDSKVYSLCGGSSYDPETEKCQSGAVVSKTTPILPQSASVGNILVHTTTNAILLSNLPSNAKVEVYNIQGKLVFTSGKSSNRENRGSDNLRIGVQTKGMYIVKVGSRTMRVAVR